MAVGDSVVINGEEFEVVWDGGEGLICDRPTKPNKFWTPPKRIYNKKNTEYWEKREKGIINPLEDEYEPVVRESGADSVLEHLRRSRERRGSAGESD